MHLITQDKFRPGAAFACVLNKRQILRITGKSPVSLVVFNKADTNERFDDSRTRGNQNKFYVSAGDCLISKSNRRMMKIIEDSFTWGSHDLAMGMSDGARIQDPNNLISKAWNELCAVLRPWGIMSQDIPTPLNLFKTVRIDGTTGALKEIKSEQTKPAHVDLKAEIDCIVAISVSLDDHASEAEFAIYNA